MAEHIVSVASSLIPKVSPAEFITEAVPGRVLFCEGSYGISKAIEDFTHSPWSHVATVMWLPFGVWGVMEATAKHGVHAGLLDYYVNTYKGSLVLAQTPELSRDDFRALLATQYNLIDDEYDFAQEAEMVAHKLLPFFPVGPTKNEYFCSGLYCRGRAATQHPLQWTEKAMPSPEQVWLDPSIEPVCALVKG